MNTTATPWGYPDNSNGGQSWLSQYAGWLLLAGLVVLCAATANGGKTHAK